MTGRNKMFFLVLAVSFCFLGTTAAVAFEKIEKEAVNVAVEWLEIVDSGQYEKSWEEAATLFRTTVSSKQWEQSLAASRKPLGKLISRKLKSKTFTETLPGAPDGKYVVIKFDTVFENKASAVETVTPMLDTDGVWRVSGYYLR